MRLMGFLLMISGLVIVLAALALLAGPGQRIAFIVAGIAIELLGLALIAHGYKSLQATARQRRVTR
jgi:uncharacterized membrane protein HdeD (DUF308 family)